MTTSYLSLQELTPSIILADPIKFKESIINSSKQLISSISSTSSSNSSTTNWKKGKTYNKAKSLPTTTYKKKQPIGAGNTENYNWFARISIHSNKNKNNNENDANLFELFKEGLFLNHSVNESIYIKDCTTAELIESFAEGLEVWRTTYHLPAPLTNREFQFLIHTVDTTPSPTLEIPNPLKSFLVISIPFNHSQPTAAGKKYVRGKYVSVEEVSEFMDGDEKKIIWKMATASNAGGKVPKKITEMAMPSKISEDVPAFINYLEKLKSRK